MTNICITFKHLEGNLYLGYLNEQRGLCKMFVRFLNAGLEPLPPE